MTCDEFLRAVDPYLDDELPVTEILRVQEHAAACAACRHALDSEASLHALLAASALDEEPSAGLRARLARATGGAPLAPARGWRRRIWLRALPAAMLATGVCAGILLTVLLADLHRGPEIPPLAMELAAKHALYSGRDGGLELRTGEADEMTAWLRQRLGFPVALPALARPGERLVGARISSVADGPAAYLAYERGGGRISLFIARTPAAALGGTRRIVDGVELYVAAVGDMAIVWWDDDAQVYAAASRSGLEDVIDFALLCVRSRPDAVRPSSRQERRAPGHPAESGRGAPDGAPARGQPKGGVA